MCWRVLDSPRAWTQADRLLALQADQLNMLMWMLADPKRRGHKPRPLPRPGGGTKPERRHGPSTTPDRIDRWLAGGFDDITGDTTERSA